jgi:hypothetical protein
MLYGSTSPATELNKTRAVNEPELSDLGVHPLWWTVKDYVFTLPCALLLLMIGQEAFQPQQRSHPQIT